MSIVTVAAKTQGEWVTPAGELNIAVGVKGSSYEIQVHLGTNTMPFPAGKPASGITMIAKCSQLRVNNTGNYELSFEVL